MVAPARYRCRMKIAIIQTRLPYIDRRALSQAWFSALHLAQDGKDQRCVRPHRDGAVAARALAVTRVRARPDPKRAAQTSLPARAVIRDRRVSGVLGGTLCRTGESKKISTGAAHDRARSYPPFRMSLTFGVDGSRVQLLLRRDGPTLYVVALCRPEIAETVRRALACADAHLRLRGESMQAAVQTTTEAPA